ncbi:STAM-binding protein [Pseudohyphozyma bogoriensis]|nr:STAM-binding protein [Pseudohyphozyma bogoriensis]
MPPPPPESDGPPLSISQLADLATSSLVWDATQPLRRYIGAVRQLVQESKVYQKEGDLDRAFVLAVKVNTLTTDLLPNRHPEWPALPAAARAQIAKDSENIGLQISELKRLISARFEAYERGHAFVPPSRPASAATTKSSPATPTSPYIARATVAPGSTPALTLKNTVQPSTNTMSSSPAVPDFLGTRPPVGKEGRAAKLKRKFGVGKNKDRERRVELLVEPGEKVDVEDEAIRDEWTLVDEKEKERRREWEVPDVRIERTEEVRRGSMPMPGEDDEEEEEDGMGYGGRGGGIPWAPQKKAVENGRASGERDAGMMNFGMASLSETLVEEEELAKTEGGQPLRNVVLPIDLMPHFVKLAKANTERGIETCGLLMGTLSHNTFSITHLLVPKQEGTTDTCTTTAPEEEFAFQDERDLMTLGWIHTHPTQTCFMSSLDLHTHASYQVMLAEAIAIVCAPKHDPGFGIFRLTDPPGLETIVKCDTPGMFHPHPDLPIYTDTDHGHVQLRSRAKFESHDLRRR